MTSDAPQVRFLLAIEERTNEDGLPGYRVGHNIMMPREPLITLIRTWLRRIEKEYDDYFANQN